MHAAQPPPAGAARRGGAGAGTPAGWTPAAAAAMPSFTSPWPAADAGPPPPWAPSNGVLTNPLAAFSPDVLADMLLLDSAHVTPRRVRRLLLQQQPSSLGGRRERSPAHGPGARRSGRARAATGAASALIATHTPGGVDEAPQGPRRAALARRAGTGAKPSSRLRARALCADAFARAPPAPRRPTARHRRSASDTRAAVAYDAGAFATAGRVDWCACLHNTRARARPGYHPHTCAHRRPRARALKPARPASSAHRARSIDEVFDSDYSPLDDDQARPARPPGPSWALPRAQRDAMLGF
jgi:hypothetical protein